MALTADQIIDRRNLRRKVTFWRVASILILVALVFALVSATGILNSYGKKNRDHIAKVEITGVITNDEPMLKLLGSLKDNDRVKGVILNISSPGGSTVGGEAMFEAVRELAEAKPVVTNVGTLAASAGYMIAAGTDHIVARRSSIVGSIGVLFQYVDASDLLSKVGVKVDEIKSAPLKAEPSPFHPASDEAKAMIDRLIQDTYQWFVDLVAERRNMTKLQAMALADGSIFTGAQGLKNGLVDAIGGEAVAKQWLVEERSIDKKLKTIEWKPKRAEDSLLANPASLIWIANKLGIPIEPSTGDTMRQMLPERLFLDGLVSKLVGS